MELESYSPTDVCVFLKEQIPNISESILEAIEDHKIDGGVFMELTEEYLREIAPLLGDRLKIKRAIRLALSMNSPVSFLSD